MLPVLIIDLAKRYGGVEARVFDLANALHGRYPYAVATLTNSPLHQRLQTANLVSLPVPFARHDPRVLPFIVRAIRQGGYQVVDAHNVQSQFWGHLAALWVGKVAKISTVHSAYGMEHNPFLRGWIYEQILGLNAVWGCRFIAVSEAISAYLRNLNVPLERISVIHNSLCMLPPSSATPHAPLLQSLGWDHTVYIVTVVARLEPVKGHTYLLEALRRTVLAYPELRCLIVGEGRLRSRLESQVKHARLQRQVHFAGFRDDIPTLLSASNAFCLPSRSEGLPYALLEACVHRLPVLATAVGGIAELLRHKKTAFLVPPADPAALAEGLCWLLDHPREAAAMAQAAFDRLQQRFNPDVMVAKTLEIYQQ